ncbi:MAG: tRNA (N6-isopentenyl adenosine(37)-C2)-methylthiotransferase MiaB [Gammaproteobacteria bacterium]|nr:tRNA (N6-isopentenyl adenosine(37)-C2)-methylthiotransferase MiaB [Gammaproteobacteria bacterium]
MRKKVYFETYGCQMNVHDSEKATYVLSEAGYDLAFEPAEADLVLLNTCMVREKAARKVYARINELKRELSRAANRPGLPIFGVMGCVAQAEADRLFERSKDIKLVVGTQAIPRLPDLVEQLENGFDRAIDVRLSKEAEFLELQAESRQTKYIAYITITEGCNKFCSFCIVPFTRGRERSRPADRIVAEAKALLEQGYCEIHLLGQNVNSYGLSGRYHGNSGPFDADGEITFARLLERVAEESGIPRIKFTTSYPRDFDEEIVKVMDAHENLCEWIHLPAQAGSDRVLRAMRRGYTRREYLDKIEAIKSSKKDISITGDMIVGFPGETAEDFNETMSLVAEVGYDGLYIFKYSPRPRTPAATYTDSIPEEVKTERFLKLQELQDRIQRLRYERYLGRIVEVLVEGASSRSSSDYTGHTRCHKVVNFPIKAEALGKLVKVRIAEVKSHSLYGEVNHPPLEFG